MMKIISTSAICAALAMWQAQAQSQNPTPQAIAAARTACTADLQRLCVGVEPGGGRLLSCLKQHQNEVSDGCKQAVLSALHGGGGQPGAGPAVAAQAPVVSGGGAPVSPGPATAVQSIAANTTPAAPIVDSGQPVAGAAGGSATVRQGHTIVMKRVQIIDKTTGKGPMVAYTVMIPSSWQFDGRIATGTAKGGCFADTFPLFAEARSPDGAFTLTFGPQTTLQFVDDPAGQKSLNQRNLADQKYGMKPCPVLAPMTAADYLRNKIIPEGTRQWTLVSVSAFPELDQITRNQLGLATGDGVRTDAARARFAFTDEKGQAAEAWLTAAVVVRSFPYGGRGASYDWHVVNVFQLQAPKGQLDAQDRLLQLIVSTLRPDPAWQAYSNDFIMQLARAKQQAVAAQDAAIAQFQAKVIATIQGVTANQQAGAQRSVNGADQIIRSVQTFRDPASGKSYELSNLYDHAWLNANNEYVMSDDPNFDPNASLTGNWTPLQLQH